MPESESTQSKKLLTAEDLIKKDRERHKGISPITIVVMLVLVIAGISYITYISMMGAKFDEAVLKGDAATVKSLLASHPEYLIREETEKSGSGKADSRQPTGITPLHRAVEKGNREVVEVLLLHGAQVNAVTGKDKRTPLHMVVFAPDGKRTEIAALLIKEHARMTLKDREGKTPLDLAKENNKEDLVTLFTEEEAKKGAKGTLKPEKPTPAATPETK